MVAVLYKMLFIFGLFHINDAIRCYICQSRSNPECSDTVNTYKLELTECTSRVIQNSASILADAYSQIRDISPDEAMDLVAGVSTNDIQYASRMVCQKTAFVYGSETVVVRGCKVADIIPPPGEIPRWSPRDPHASCSILEEKIRTESGAYMYHCDTCSQSGCNSAPGQHLPSSFTIVFPLILVTVLLLR